MKTKKQAAEITRLLEQAYPIAECTLDTSNAWQLLVSVRLAAQCTDARVNIIPYHPIGGDSLRPSSRRVQENFRDGLNDLGITATIRASRGQDIMAACGMLAGAAKKQQPPYQDEE